MTGQTGRLRQLAHGTPLTDLGALLGLRDEEALQRYRAVVPARVKVY